MDRFVQRNVGTILPDVLQGKVKVYLILQFNRTFDGVNCGRKLNQKSISHGFDDAAAMRVNQWREKIFLQPAEN